MTRLARQVHSPEDMEALAAELSLLARPDQFILLRGDLGAGKSVFARGFIRALAPQDANFDIPSPTFTLIQTYDETRIPVAHADLYRVNSAAEVEELGLDDLCQTHIVTIEWPERLGPLPSSNVLDISITGHGTERHVEITGSGTWALALDRNTAIHAFLATTPWAHAQRRFLEGDASFRRYETLEGRKERVILMDMPARPDGPPVKDGKPYSAIAHLAEDIRAVIAVNSYLSGLGYSAPIIHAHDSAAGLAVIEDLGSRLYGRMRLSNEDMQEPMRAAVDVLADMASRTWPLEVAAGETDSHRIAPYDQAAQLIEVDLLPMWFWPYLRGVDVPPGIREAFADAWAGILPLTLPSTPMWTLRDYHSPNLLWLPERQGLKRVGLIDTQDCVLGHPAYDLAALLQDARVDIEPAEERELFDYYCGLRLKDKGFKRGEFEAAYAVLGAQRAVKILGIFARLSKRDGKHGYLQHLPRVSRYLERNLQHPALGPLKTWFARHLPQQAREVRP